MPGDMLKPFQGLPGVRELSILLLTGITGSTVQSDGVYTVWLAR